MGISHSCDAAAATAMTAKLIFHDGELVEFPYPVKVSHVLQKNPTCFICNSDEMAFDDFVSAIGADEELQPGQLYFALPLSRLRYPIQAKEMAALAVKASSALRKNGAPNCSCRRKTAIVPTVSCQTARGDETISAVEIRRGGGKGSGCNLAAKLSAIPE